MGAIGHRPAFVRDQQRIAREAIARGEARVAREALRCLVVSDFLGGAATCEELLAILRDGRSSDLELAAATMAVTELQPANIVAHHDE